MTNDVERDGVEAQDGPDAGGTSQGEPGEAGASQEADKRPAHEPGSQRDTNERADEKVRVIGPDGHPVPGDGGEGS